MYYIINQTNQIIAIDDALLSLLQLKDIETLTSKIILNEVLFSLPTEENITITYNDKSHHFHAHIHTLSSVLGGFRLVHLQEIKIEDSKESPVNVEDDYDDLLFKDNSAHNKSDLLNISPQTDTVKNDRDDELSTLILPNEAETSIDEIVIDQDNIQKESDILSISPELDTPQKEIDESEVADELFTLTLPDEAETSIDEIVIDQDNIQKESDILSISPELDTPQKEIDEPKSADELFTLTLPNEVEATIDEIVFDAEEDSLVKEKSDTLDNTPIHINIEQISKTIGISQEDYKTFLNEYIDSALSLEDPLKSDNKEKRLAAIETLTQLADVLQLPKVNNVISKIETNPADERPQIIHNFYNLLSRLTVHTEAQVQPQEIVEEEINEKKKDLSLDGFGSIDLHDVKPIHFNFQISQAANDLSLPEELIEEFVHDFIEQAHEETQKMLNAYESGDLESIQKIGHLLKGTSSNLRIKELADTLLAIQHCEDSTQLEDLIKEYWGHFLSFEQQIDVISTKRK